MRRMAQTGSRACPPESRHRRPRPPSTRSTTLVRQWLTAERDRQARPERRAPRRRAEGPARPRVHDRLRRRRHAAREPEGRGTNLERVARSCPGSCPGTCEAPCGRRRVRDPAAVAHRPDRPARAARDGRPPGRRRAPKLARPSRRSATTACASTSICSARPCSASARRCAGWTASTSCSPAPTSTTSRSRSRPSRARSRCGRSTRSSQAWSSG